MDKSPATQDPGAAELARLLDRAVASLEALAAMGETSRGAGAASEEPEAIAGRINLRAPITGVIAGMAPQIASALGRWPTLASTMAPGERDAMERRIERFRALVSEHERANAALLTSLERRRDELAAQVASLGKGRSAMGAYGVDVRPPAGPDTPRYQDRSA